MVSHHRLVYPLFLLSADLVAQSLRDELEAVLCLAFGLVFFSNDWRHRLFDDWEGLLATSPIWYLVPLTVWIAWKHPQRRLLSTVLAGACGYTLLMLTFSYWESAYGPRFVFPCTALLLVLAAALFERPQGRKAHPMDTGEASD